MIKTKSKYITVIILLLLLFVIIFSYSKISHDTSLNANNNINNNTNTPALYVFEEARNSTQNYIDFENNFGGSKSDILLKTYTLDFYYLIGHTNSSDYYFQSTTVKNVNHVNTVFIIKMSNSGNAINVSTIDTTFNISLVSTFLYGNGIFLLCEVDGQNKTILYEYNFNTNQIITTATFDNFQPYQLYKSEEVIHIAGVKNERLALINYNLISQQKLLIDTNILISSIHLLTTYSNGLLIFSNYESTFKIIYIENHTTILYENITHKLYDFNINENGFLLILQNIYSTQIILLDLNFKVIKSNTFSSYSSTSLIYLNNVNYLFSTTSQNTINIKIFSSNADIVFDINLSLTNVKTLITTKIINNNIVIFYYTTENNISITTINYLTAICSQQLITNTSNTQIKEIEINNNSIYLFGTFTTKNALHCNNFGLEDIFILKFNYITL